MVAKATRSRLTRSKLLREPSWRPNQRLADLQKRICVAGRFSLKTMKKDPPNGESFFMAPGTGFEPAT
jgi:hypothetical protein